MKRVIFILMSIILIFSALGCGGKSTDKKLSKAAKDIYSEIKEKVTFPEMMDMDSDFIMNYYGIDSALLQDYSFSTALVSIQVDTVIIAEVKDKKDLSDIQGKIQKLLDAKAAEMKNYLPDMYNIVSKGKVKTEGKVVYLVISEKAEEIEKIITDNIA